MDEIEYQSFLRKGYNFGMGSNSLETSKQFWMTPEGLENWNNSFLSGPYNVTIEVPSRIIGLYGLVQPRFLDGHLAGTVLPRNLNSFIKSKIVITVIKR